MSARFPRWVLVGVHRECRVPFEYLLEAGETVVGFVTLRPKSARRVSGAVDLRPLAERFGVPVLEVRNVNDAESVEWIRALAPDVVLVVGWTQLLKEPLLRLPSIACVGFHASLLPAYRGRAPINWALIHGETETGNTMIVLEPGADEGDIVAQRRIPIVYEDTCATLYDKVSATEVEMIAAILPGLREGRLPRRPQDAASATVMPKRRPEDGLIDWNRPTRRLYDWVRALTHPYPGAFTWVGGERKVFVWAAIEGAREASDAAPGTVAVDSGWPVVRTADGWLRLSRVQAEGDDEVDAREGVGAILSAGDRLGTRTEADA